MPRTAIGSMFVLPNDVWNGQSFILYGEYAHSETNLVRALSRGTCLDIGAHIGALTIPMAREAAHVYAFEPQPVIACILKANLAINGITNASVVEAAVGSDMGRVFIPNISYGEEMANFGMVSCTNNKTESSIEVPLITIDSLKLDNVEFVKIDVEGMEHKVLEGMADTARRCRPFILMECDREESGRAAIKTARDLGYVLYWAITPLFRENNFFNNREGVPKTMASFDVLCQPKEKPMPFTGLRPVEDSDPIGTCPLSYLVSIEER